MGFNGFRWETDPFPIRTSLQHDFLTWVDKPVDDSFGDDGILEELDPAPGIDLAGDDDGALSVTLLQDVHEASGLFVSVISKPEVVQDEDVGPVEISHVDEITAGDFLGLDFLHEQIDRGKEDTDFVLTEPASDSLSEVGFPLAGFAEDDEILFGMMEGAMGKLIQLGLGDTAVEGQIPVLKIQGCAEACFGDKALGDLRSAEEGFILQEQAEEFDMVEILALGLSQSGFDGAMEAKEPEFMGERFDGVDDGHGDFLS